jgi:hypothetical protein
MIRRASLTWLLLIPVAIANGTLREVVLNPMFRDLTARQISVVTGSAAFLVLAYLMMRDYAAEASDRLLLKIGGVWVVDTVIFEFALGHFIEGKSWVMLLRDYNVFAGYFWPVVLVVVFLAPLIVKRVVAQRGSGCLPLGTRHA